MRIDKEELIILGVVWLVRADQILWEITQNVFGGASYLPVKLPRAYLDDVVNAVFKESWLPNGQD